MSGDTASVAQMTADGEEAKARTEVLETTTCLNQTLRISKLLKQVVEREESESMAPNEEECENTGKTEVIRRAPPTNPRQECSRRVEVPKSKAKARGCPTEYVITKNTVHPIDDLPALDNAQDIYGETKPAHDRHVFTQHEHVLAFSPGTTTHIIAHKGNHALDHKQ